MSVSRHVVTSSFRRWIGLWLTPQNIGWIAVLLMIMVVAFPVFMSAMYVMLGTHMLIAAQGGTGSQEDVTYALGLLEQARDWTPSEPHVYRMLAQAYQLNNQPELAVAALERAYRLRPESLLIQQELAAAYEVAGHMERVNAFWMRSGVLPIDMIALGDAALDLSEYEMSNIWYDRALRLDLDLQSQLALRRFLAAHLTGSSTAANLLSKARANDQALVVYTLEDTIKINGSHLRWMLAFEGIFGRMLSYGAGDNTTMSGYLWWTGQAFAVVSVQQAGNYQISMHVLHNDPPPIDMAIGVNGQQIQQVSLDKGDNSWETITIDVFLKSAIHTIHVWFLNDAYINGKDRNAIIKWLLIEKDKLNS